MLKLVWDADSKANEILARAWDKTFQNTAIPLSDWKPSDSNLPLPNYFEQFLEHLNEDKK